MSPFILIGIVGLVIGFFVGLKIWKEEGFFSMWHLKLLINAFKSLFTLHFIKFIKYYLCWIITVGYGMLSIIPALASIGGSNTRRTNNSSDNTTTYIAQGQADAMNGASPLHPENPQYMSAYNDYKNNQ